MSWAERSTGISPTITQFLFAQVGRDRQHRRRYHPTSASRSRRVGPFPVDGDPGHQVLIADDLGAAPAPLVLAQVECYTRRSAASRTRRGGEVRQPASRRWLLCFIPIPSVTSTDSPRSCSVHRRDPPGSHWPCRWTSTAPAITTCCTPTCRAWTPIRWTSALMAASSP